MRLVPFVVIILCIWIFGKQYIGFSAPAPAPLTRHSVVSAETSSLCAAHGYTAFEEEPNSPKRKVYDLMMVNTELDWLEIRLNTLYDHVDWFIVVESPRTFQMGPRELMLKQNWSKFEKYQNKIIYHELQFPENFKPSTTWDVEDLQRNAMFDQVLPALKGEQAPVYGDAILVSDVDEIPRPETVDVLRKCNYPLRLTLNSRFYYYSFQFLHDGPEWPHPQATIYRGNDDTIRPGNLRNGDGGIPILREFEKGVYANSSWHCSSCFATIDQVLNKMASFSHMWMNRPKYRNPDHIANAVRQGKDIWGRRRDTFQKIEHNLDIPQILQDEGERFPWLVNRDRGDVGFTDYKPGAKGTEA